MIRFIDVPVGATFTTENGIMFKKTRQPSVYEYHTPTRRMYPNCILLSNNHKCCMGVMVKCELVDEED